MSARVYACARCGLNARFDDTFLCDYCLYDPVTRREQGAVEATFPGDYREQRLLLTSSYHWAGWNRRMKGASRA